MSLMTQAQYSRHRGCSRQYVNKLVKQGKIPVTPDGYIPWRATDTILGERGYKALLPQASTNWVDEEIERSIKWLDQEIERLT